MADYDRRRRGGGGGGGGGGQFNNRKRRYRGTSYSADRILISDYMADDDFEDRRPQRRRYEEPLASTLRKQVLSIAESVRCWTEPSSENYG